MFLERNLA